MTTATTPPLEGDVGGTIVQELFALQERSGGWLPREGLEQLAERLSVPRYRLQQVASFFNHFRFTPPPAAEVRVCRDFSCHLAGADRFREDLEQATKDVPGVEIVGASCLGRCDAPVGVQLNHHGYSGLSVAEAARLITRAANREKLHAAISRDELPTSWSINPYPADSEWSVVRRLATAADPIQEAETILRSLEESGLVGKGGPGARTAKKWREVLKQTGRVKHVVANGDESEPGTFKDREIMLRLPHLVIEGVITAGLILGAERCYVYVRHEFVEQIAALRQAITRARAAGACGDRLFGTGKRCHVEVFISPGNYICGEQTAMIEAMEGKRAEPRQRPPDLEIRGLFDRPTLVNNVETFAWIPSILLRGPEWYRGLGSNGCTGARFVSVSGHVERPGVYQVPLGITVGELLDLCGGMKGEQSFRAFCVSGPSGGFLPALLPRDSLPKRFAAEQIPADAPGFDLMSLRLDNNDFRNHRFNFTLGAAHLFVGEEGNLPGLARNATEFYRNESCGKCVPCRVGGEKLVSLADRLVAGRGLPIDRLEDLNLAMRQASICGLGQVASVPLASLAQFFPEEIRAKAPAGNPTPSPHAELNGHGV